MNLAPCLLKCKLRDGLMKNGYLSKIGSSINSVSSDLPQRLSGNIATAIHRLFYEVGAGTGRFPTAPMEASHFDWLLLSVDIFRIRMRPIPNKFPFLNFDLEFACSVAFMSNL